MSAMNHTEPAPRPARLEWYHFTIAGVFLTAVGITLMEVVGPGFVSIGVVVAGSVLNLIAVLKAMQDGDSRPGEAGT